MVGDARPARCVVRRVVGDRLWVGRVRPADAAVPGSAAAVGGGANSVAPSTVPVAAGELKAWHRVEPSVESARWRGIGVAFFRGSCAVIARVVIGVTRSAGGVNIVTSLGRSGRVSGITTGYAVPGRAPGWDGPRGGPGRTCSPGCWAACRWSHERRERGQRGAMPAESRPVKIARAISSGR